MLACDDSYKCLSLFTNAGDLKAVHHKILHVEGVQVVKCAKHCRTTGPLKKYSSSISHIYIYAVAIDFDGASYKMIVRLSIELP